MNNKGFPHNVVFDDDAVPAGVSAEALSHEDYLNAAGDSVSTTFDVAGSYSYYCVSHQGAGMQGKVVVKSINTRQTAASGRRRKALVIPYLLTFWAAGRLDTCWVAHPCAWSTC